MKVGDKVYCKKNIKRTFMFYVGKTYTITDIDVFSGINIYTLYDNNTYIGSIGSGYYYDEHFMDIQEYRRLKLKKLNEKI